MHHKTEFDALFAVPAANTETRIARTGTSWGRGAEPSAFAAKD
jgi:hypothetical protein